MELSVITMATFVVQRAGSKGGEFQKTLLTEPLKVRKVLTSSSAEKRGCRATRLMNLLRARLLPSMNSRSEMEVRTVDRQKKKAHIDLL